MQSPERNFFNTKSGLLHEIPLKKRDTQSFAGIDSSLHTKSQAISIIQGQTNNDGTAQNPKRSLELKTAKQIEDWFNEAVEPYVKLIDPDPLKTPLMKLRIDRITLGKLGIITELIERLYRSIYVSSVSFFQTLADVLKHQKGNGLICRIWKGYLIVLQAICLTDFEDANAEFMRLADVVAIEAKLELQNFKDSMMKDESAKETLMRYLQEENNQLHDEKQRNDKAVQFNNIELSKTRLQLEEEIKVRLEFEYRINKLVSTNRLLKINEKTYIDRIAQLELNNSELKASNNSFEKMIHQQACQMRQCNLETAQTRREHSEFQNELETFKKMHFELEKKFLQNEERLGQRHNLWMKNMTEISMQNTQITALNIYAEQLKTADKEMQEKVIHFQKKYDEQSMFIEKEIKDQFCNSDELKTLKDQLYDQEFANELLVQAQYTNNVLSRKRDQLNTIIQHKDIVLKQLQEKIFELERRYDQTNQQLVQANKTIKVCNKKIEDQTKTIDTTLIVLDGLQKQNQDKQREIDMFNVRTDNLKEEVKIQKQNVADFERSYDAQVVKSKMQSNKIDEFKAHILELEKSIQEHIFVQKNFAINLKHEQTLKLQTIADRDLKVEYIKAQGLEIMELEVRLQMAFNSFSTISVRLMLTGIKLAMTTKFIRTFVTFYRKEIDEMINEKEELLYKIEKQWQKIFALDKTIEELNTKAQEAQLEKQDNERIRKALNSKADELRQIINQKEEEKKETLKQCQVKDERINELEQHRVKVAKDQEKKEEQVLKEAQKQEGKIKKVRQEVIELKGQGLEYVRVIQELKKSFYEDQRAVQRKKSQVNDRGVQVMPTVNSFAVQTDTAELGYIIKTGASNNSSLSGKDLDQHSQQNIEQLRNALNDEALTIKKAKQLLQQSLTLAQQNVENVLKSHQSANQSAQDQNEESIVVIKSEAGQTMMSIASQDLDVSDHDKSSDSEEGETDQLAQDADKTIKVIQRPTKPKQIRGMITNAFLRRGDDE